MTFRFAAAVFIMLLLVVTNTAVLIKHYEQRLADYDATVKMNQRQLQETKTYSAGEMYVDRPLNPLCIFNAGFDERLGNTVSASYRSVPSLWDSWKRGSDNPFMDMFASMDIVLIFEVILSLLALIFAYDTLTGEYEHGTLRLVLTHPVPRGHILLAKYISAMLCLLVPLLMSLLLSIILLTTSTAISLNTNDFLRIGGIVLISVTIFQQLLESLAGTGFERHLQFLENVQSYARQFREFIIDTDRADPESLHIFGVREGMSQKPVPIEVVPKFEDTLNLSKDFNAAVVDLLLLMLFVIVLLSGAYLAFVRVEI